MKSGSKVVLHGGFHKTATSHIQSTLQRNAKHLARHGVCYVHHRETRKRLTVPVQCNAFEAIGIGWDPKISDDELRAITQNLFSEIGQTGADRVIFSDENLAGHCGHCVKKGGLYRWRGKLIETFAAQFDRGVDEIFLSIRNYADFFASAYIEYLRSYSGAAFIDEANLRANVLGKMPNWLPVLETVLDSFPDATLTVWRYEDFNQLKPHVLSALCGDQVEVTNMKTPKETNKRPSASHRAVQEILQRMHQFGADVAVQDRVAIQEAYPRGETYKGYDPWTPAERAHLLRIYDRDVAQIRSDPRITFLEPECAEAA